MDRWVMQITTTVSWSNSFRQRMPLSESESRPPEILSRNRCWHPGTTSRPCPQDLHVYSWRKNSKWKLHLGECVHLKFYRSAKPATRPISLVLICCGWAQTQAEGWVPKLAFQGGMKQALFRFFQFKKISFHTHQFLMQLKAMLLTMVNIKSAIKK